MRSSLVSFSVLFLCVAGCANAPQIQPDSRAEVTACRAGPPIDLARYMGRWYVIAETSVLNERDYVGNYDEWTLRRNGEIDDLYLGRRYGFDQPVTGSHFVAKVVPGTGNTRWRVGLIWPFEIVVVTAFVDPDYRYTIRCIADARTVWLLSRTPEMEDATYADMQARLARIGFEIDRIRRVPQNPRQIGAPGFR